MKTNNVNLTESEQFFLNKIREWAKKTDLRWTKVEEELLMESILLLGGDEAKKKASIELNNKVIGLLRQALNEDLRDGKETHKIRLSFFKSVELPADWYRNYMNVYNNSSLVLNGVLQNLIIGNPFE